MGNSASSNKFTNSYIFQKAVGERCMSETYEMVGRSLNWMAVASFPVKGLFRYISIHILQINKPLKQVGWIGL